MLSRGIKNIRRLVRIAYTVKLSGCKKNDGFRVTAIYGCRRDILRLWRTGICPKATGEVLKEGRVFVVYINGALIGLSRDLSDRIEVETHD